MVKSAPTRKKKNGVRLGRKGAWYSVLTGNATTKRRGFAKLWSRSLLRLEPKVSPLVCIYLSRMFHRKKLIINLVAIAYVMHKTAYVFPIIGGRKVEHLLANLEALDIS